MSRPVAAAPVAAPVAAVAHPAAPSLDSLLAGRCVPCEGGVPTLTPAEVAARLALLHGWETTDDGAAIRREWNAGTFVNALLFFQQVGEIAEEQGHHPDLHLTGYRHAAVVLTTHAVGGLTENDFILAAKFDALPAPQAAGA